MSKKTITSRKHTDDIRYIYVLLSRTHTLPARLIRLYTREPYSHVSIALDAELRELYSFARKHRYNPFDGGFVKEDLDKGIFGSDVNIQCRVYKVPVTNKQYAYIRKEIGHFVENRDVYGYNYFGLFSAMFGKSHEDGTHFLCSQFVSYVFYHGGIKLFSKDNGLVRPFDFHIKLKDNQIYDGKLCAYREFLKKQEEAESDHGDSTYAEAM